MRILYIIPACIFLLLGFLCEGLGWALRVSGRAVARCEEWTMGAAIECGARSGL